VFYKARKCLSVLKSDFHLSLSWARHITSTNHLISLWFILKLSSNIHFPPPSGIFYSGSLVRNHLLRNTYHISRINEFWAPSWNFEKRLLATSCPSVRVKQLGSQWTDFDKTWYLSFFFENLSRKSKFNKNPIKITGTLHEDVSTFMTISLYILLRMRNALSKRRRENQNTHCLFNNFFSKIVPFVRECRKIWFSQRGHK
jgi:hypothetical protein